MESTNSSRQKIGERLVEAGVATSVQVNAALRAQRSERGRLGYHLLHSAGVPAAKLARFLSDELESGAERSPLAAVPEEVRAVVPPRVAHVYNVYPLAINGNCLDLALPPFHGADALEVVANVTGLIVEPRILPAELLREAVERDYLGASGLTLEVPTVGLKTLVVEDLARDVRPVAPPLRTHELSAEAWLRSALAEAVASGSRELELVPGPTGAKLSIAGKDSGTGLSAKAHGELAKLLFSLGDCPAPSAGQAASLGACQVLIRGRRLLLWMSCEEAGHGPRIRLTLAERKLAAEDLDALCEDAEDVCAGIEQLVEEGARGLLLIVSPEGGGSRRCVELLGSRLAETLEGGAHVGASTAGNERYNSSAKGLGDLEIAACIQEASSTEEPLIVVSRLPGPRSMERALLAASRKLVIASFGATDAAATLAWMTAQGLAGALKNDLLRGVLTVLTVEPACTCAGPRPVPPELAARFGLTSNTPALGHTQANRGCPSCLDAAVTRPRPLLQWLDVPGLPEDELIVEDPVRTRRQLRAACGPSPFERALNEAREGGELEIGMVLRLLGGEVP